MDAEVLTILSNIESLIEQAKMMSGAEGEAPVEPEAPQDDVNKILEFMKQMEAPKDEEPKDEDEVEKSAEGATASDDAEARIEDQPEESKDAVSEVAKALAKLMSRGSKEVKKSADSGVDKLTKVVKALVDRNSEVEKTLENILEGLGIADKIKKNYEVQKSMKEVPRNDPSEIKKTLDEIKTALGGNKEPGKKSFFNSENTLHKSLTENDGEFMKAIFQKQ